ncbi:MAG: N(4)-(beta-N-acetylglucosaminyl)-L-asparaginase [Candidatus Sumerlaeota bacterium]|nr:N(4)-(beta-N-acetylglucosaminyl)-L-asparaginase [Candidatus Sumerlaeota bacterium]
MSRLLPSPLILSTWEFGLRANEAGWRILARSGKALDAVEATATAAEDDPKINTVGYGGYPNEDGVVQLDAALIDGKSGRMGAVLALEGIRHPTAVARKILEAGKHIYLAGAGAKSFALGNGFKEENLLIPKTLQWYAEAIKERSAAAPPAAAKRSKTGAAAARNTEGLLAGHDTIGILARDRKGGIAAACSSSGSGLKWRGRVGDSPIIGAGLYLDQETGGAVCTGLGERAIEVCGSFAVVEFMRQGMTPQEACEQILRRTAKRNESRPDFQLAFIALRSDGAIGAACMKEGFVCALRDKSGSRIFPGRLYGRDFH